MNRKEAIKAFAYEMGADLVGFGNIGRCAEAPLMMSPQGLMPRAQTVVVMGIHHPDACVELGGESHPQEIGPYSVQYLMNSRLDELSYRMATFLEERGGGAIPICSSNIWRYNRYKDLAAVFAPDVSNIYMPVVAGLADMGYSGLALTPEYGARNRFVTVITDLVVAPDPLIEPGTLCDRCMLCRKHCPSQALSKEIDGEKVLRIEGREYRFANKNLWRCAWGEHFDLDLDLELPERVTEEVIVDTVRSKGIRSGEMGQCLKFCLPADRRTFDPAYSKTPLRRTGVVWDESLESRAVTDRLLAACYAKGIEHVVVQSAAALRARGIELEHALPGAVAAISLLRTRPRDEGNRHAAATGAAWRQAAQYHVDSVCYDLTRDIEALGFRSLMTLGQSASHPDALTLDGVSARLREDLLGDADFEWCMNTVFTRKHVPERALALAAAPPQGAVPTRARATASLAGELKACARACGADLVGIGSAARIDALAAQLAPRYDGEAVLVAEDRSHRFKAWEPEVRTEERCVRRASDYLPQARSVIVLGLRYHHKVLEFATQPPAEAVGPYAFQTYVTRWQGGLIASRLQQRLQHLGYRAVLATDLMGLGSAIASPRGFIEDHYCNRFAAVAAGLGMLSRSGRVVTPDFGIRQRFVAVVTDAELPADPLLAQTPGHCADCGDRCRAACPTAAFLDEEVALELEGVVFRYVPTDANRCDWSKRYAIAGESGFKYLGSPLDQLPEAAVTPAALATALKGHDPIKKYRPVVCEPCVLACPYAAVAL